MKPGYKQTEVGVIPEEWEVKLLGDVLTLQRGFDLPSRLREEGTVPIVSSSGISATHSEARVCAPGIVTGRYGTIGQVFFLEQNFWPLNTTLYVRSFKGNDPLYLSYLLRTVDFASHSGKSGVPGVNRNDIHELLIALPPLSEQRAIATALSDVDRLLGALDRLIAKKRDLKQAAMQQLLTGETRLPGFEGEWEVKRLGELGKCYRGVSYSPGDLSDHDTSSTVRLLRSNNVQRSLIVFSDMQYVDRSRVSEVQNLEKHDILICMANGSRSLVGKAAQFHPNDEFTYTFGAFMGAFKPKCEAVDPNFVFRLFHTERYRAHIDVLLAGSSINNLTPGSVEDLEIPIPIELPEQTAIAEVLSEMDAELAGLEQRREKTRALKQGMMQELLTGRTRLV